MAQMQLYYHVKEIVQENKRIAGHKKDGTSESGARANIFSRGEILCVCALRIFEIHNGF